MKFGVATTMPADVKPTTPAVKVAEGNAIVEEAEAKTASLDVKPPTLLVHNLFLGLIVLAVAVGVFVYFGGVRYIRRMIKPRKRVGDSDLEK